MNANGPCITLNNGTSGATIQTVDLECRGNGIRAEEGACDNTVKDANYTGDDVPYFDNNPGGECFCNGWIDIVPPLLRAAEGCACIDDDCPDQLFCSSTTGECVECEVDPECTGKQ